MIKLECVAKSSRAINRIAMVITPIGLVKEMSIALHLKVSSNHKGARWNEALCCLIVIRFDAGLRLWDSRLHFQKNAFSYHVVSCREMEIPQTGRNPVNRKFFLPSTPINALWKISFEGIYLWVSPRLHIRITSRAFKGPDSQASSLTN